MKPAYAPSHLDRETRAADTGRAMSQNLDLAKRVSEAGRSGDTETAIAFFAEDVVSVEFGASVDTPRVFHGREALLGYYLQNVSSRLRDKGSSLAEVRRRG